MPIVATKLPVVSAGEGFKILLMITVTLLIAESLVIAPSILIIMLPLDPCSVQVKAYALGTSLMNSISHDIVLPVSEIV